ncbi:MAG: HAD-IA family hydrolase [Phormidesmis sp.]
MATLQCLGHRFENIQAILFDKDGTLADVESYLLALGRSRSQFIHTQVPDLKQPILSTFGLQDDSIDPAGLMAIGSRTENKIAAAAHVAAAGYGWIAALNLVESAFQRAEASLPAKVTQTPLIEGAAPLLRRLRSAQLKLGIVSADAQLEVKNFVDHHQLTDIGWYCGAAPETLPKTHPEFLKLACQSMGVHSSSVVIIGDSAADLQLAQQGAAGFLGMTGGWRHPPIIETATEAATRLAGNLAKGLIENLAVVSFEHFGQIEVFN